MTRKMILPALLALAALVAAPALADKVIVQLQHTDAMTIMGQTTPAEDTTQEFWFGDSAMRFDDDDITIINRLDKKKLYFVNNAEKTYSAIDLPIDFNKLVGPEMAPMMEQMAKMMGALIRKCTPFQAAEISMIWLATVNSAMTRPAMSAANAPSALARFQKRPIRKMATTGGLMRANTPCM